MLWMTEYFVIQTFRASPLAQQEKFLHFLRQKLKTNVQLLTKPRLFSQTCEHVTQQKHCEHTFTLRFLEK